MVLARGKQAEIMKGFRSKSLEILLGRCLLEKASFTNILIASKILRKPCKNGEEMVAGQVREVRIAKQ
jgi:hypothetical protein